MNSLWDIRIFLGLVPKESHCVTVCLFWLRVYGNQAGWCVSNSSMVRVSARPLTFLTEYAFLKVSGSSFIYTTTALLTSVISYWLHSFRSWCSWCGFKTQSGLSDNILRGYCSVWPERQITLVIKLIVPHGWVRGSRLKFRILVDVWGRYRHRLMKCPYLDEQSKTSVKEWFKLVRYLVLY